MLDGLLNRRPARYTAEARVAADRVEMQSIVSSRPRATDRRILLEDDSLDAALPERGRGRKASCASADDDHRGLRHECEEF